MSEPHKKPLPAGFDPLTDDDDDVNDVYDVNDVHDVDMDRRAASVNAKVNAPSAEPWDRFDPNEKPLPHPFSMRLNNYDRALIRHLASWRGISMQQAAQQILRAAALRAVDTHERRVKRANRAKRVS